MTQQPTLEHDLELPDDPAPPGRGVRAWLRARPHLVPEVLAILFLLRVYDIAREHAATRAAAALAHGRAVLSAERWLGIGVEPGAARWAQAHGTIGHVAVLWYQYCHVTMTMSALVALWLLRPHAYRPLRRALVATNVTALAVFLLVPVAPPRLLPGEHIPDLVALAGFSTSHAHVQADQYGAVPSLHVAWAVWTACALCAMTRRTWVRVLACAYPIGTSTAVVLTGNHYLFDLATGLVVAAVWLGVLVLSPLAGRSQITFRRTSTVSTSAPGTSGSQAVTIR